MSNKSDRQALSDMEAPVMILARPQMAENIGVCARAMKNCGVSDLRLIAPRDGWPNPAARPMATVATDILDEAQVFDSLADALGDISFMVATTARPRDMVKPVVSPREAAMMMVAGTDITGADSGEISSGRVAVLFGAERSGLDNDEIVLADIIAQADLNPHSSSLNLAQAVFMMCWEWRNAASLVTGYDKNTDETERHIPADLKSRSYFFDRFEQILSEKGFFPSEELAPVIKRNLRSFLSRGQPTEQELRTFHGILSLIDRLRGN